MTLAGSGSRFYNAGIVKHEGAGRLALDCSGNGTSFENLPNAVYEFLADSSLIQVNCCGSYEFDNYGLLRKAGGTNTSSVGLSFNNFNGSIEVDSGVLSLGSAPYSQGAGAFTVQLGEPIPASPVN